MLGKCKRGKRNLAGFILALIFLVQNTCLADLPPDPATAANSAQPTRNALDDTSSTNATNSSTTPQPNLFSFFSGKPLTAQAELLRFRNISSQEKIAATMQFLLSRQTSLRDSVSALAAQWVTQNVIQADEGKAYLNQFDQLLAQQQNFVQQSLQQNVSLGTLSFWRAGDILESSNNQFQEKFSSFLSSPPLSSSSHTSSQSASGLGPLGLTPMRIPVNENDYWYNLSPSLISSFQRVPGVMNANDAVDVRRLFQAEILLPLFLTPDRSKMISERKTLLRIYDAESGFYNYNIKDYFSFFMDEIRGILRRIQDINRLKRGILGSVWSDPIDVALNQLMTDSSTDPSLLPDGGMGLTDAKILEVIDAEILKLYPHSFQSLNINAYVHPWYRMIAVLLNKGLISDNQLLRMMRLTRGQLKKMIQKAKKLRRQGYEVAIFYQDDQNEITQLPDLFVLDPSQGGKYFLAILEHNANAVAAPTQNEAGRMMTYAN